MIFSAKKQLKCILFGFTFVLNLFGLQAQNLITVTGSQFIEGCEDYITFTVSGTAGAFVQLELSSQSATGGGVDFGSTTNSTLGQSNLEWYDGSNWIIYQNNVTLPSSGQITVRTPLINDLVIEPNENVTLTATPISTSLSSVSTYNVNYQTVNLSSMVLISGVAGAVNAVYKKTNAITIAGQTIDAQIKILNKVNVTSFTFDEDATNAERFQPEINSSNSAGSYVDFEIKFFNSGTTTPVALDNFFITAVDVDGSSSTVREFAEFQNFYSYQVGSNTGLTITQNFRPSFTRFLGISTSLSGITFENTASLIANYSSPIHTFQFRLGVTGSSSSARLFSLAFGNAIGTFTGSTSIANNANAILGTSIIIDASAAPTAGSITGNQAICVGSTTSFTSSATGGTWSSSSTATATVNASGLVSGAGAGTATITYTVAGTGGCTNATATRTVTVTALPSTPSASVTTQPTCSVQTGTITFTSQAGVTYSINGTSFQASNIFTGVAPGSYTPVVRATANNSCTTSGSSVTVNAVPNAPTTPAASVTVQPTCATATGTIVFTTQAGVEYSIDGTNYQASATFTGVAAGTYR
jgi:hypothetical protein